MSFECYAVVGLVCVDLADLSAVWFFHVCGGCEFFFFLMIRRPPRSTLSSSSAASDVYRGEADMCAARAGRHGMRDSPNPNSRARRGVASA